MSHRLHFPLVTRPAAPLPPRDWDSRLDALGVQLDAVEPQRGVLYWRIVSVQWQDEQEAGGRHHLDVDMRNGAGERLLGAKALVYWDGANATLTQEDKPPPEYGSNFPLYRPLSGCPYALTGLDLPSDTLRCLGLGSVEEPWRTIHTVFRVVFQRVRG